ncbi:MAG: hypothetical protein N2316_08915 [Spirochaetes bacterium]|nr:hypothetical protein [Spirochaetota bacterium]
MKLISRLSHTILLALANLCIVHSFANEVNSTNSGIIFHGGISRGEVLFGVINNTSPRSELGKGTGNGFHFGVLAHYSMACIGIAYSSVNYSELEWEEEISNVKYKMKSTGDGRYWTFDLLFGAKMFTETGDMGYSYPFVGYRFWKAVRNQEEVTYNGNPDPQFTKEYELWGKGWIIGIRDFTTFPTNELSIAFQTGIWFYNAPMGVLRANGNEVMATSEKNVGFGFEIGAGVALEDIGLALIAGIKMDVQATAFKTITLDYVAGAGYAQFFFSFAYEFSI